MVKDGDQRRRFINFYSQSKILFCFLSYHIGNESIVRVRRRIIDKKYPHNIDFWGNTLLANGSKAEGLDMKGSDTDIMMTDSTVKAYDGDDISNPLISCRYDSMSPDLKPGYVLVETWMRGYPSTLLSSSFFKTSISVFMHFLKSLFQFEPHGPAMSTSTCGEDFDLVYCIKSINWPNIASEWVLRKRKYGWPSQEMIQNIQSQGCQLVPVSKENCPNYFVRINNLFIERFTPAGKEKLLALLCEIRDSGLSWITLSSTLRKLKTFLKYPLSIQLLYCVQNVKFKKECSRLILDLSRHGKAVMSNMLIVKQTKYLLPYVKSLMNTSVIRCSFLGHICHLLDADEKKMTHKQLHTLRKLYIHLLCIGCRADLACGKTMLASWLYNQGKFTECLQVTSFVLESVKFRCFHVGTKTVAECSSTKHMTKDLSSEFLGHLNNYYTENIRISDKSDKISVRELSRFFNCILNLLSIEDYRRRNLFFYQVCPKVYCHFMRFLCYLKQADLPHSEEEFNKMIQVHFIGSEYEKNAHDMIITIMKITGRIITRNVQNDCESDIYTLNDVFHIEPDGDLSVIRDIDVSMLSSFFNRLNDLGFDENFIRRVFFFS
ncbi:unnamed protein product [Mytilus coruscus]|uniref:Mab-21-like HhH/H2TH-like domain-containing protein n=1 Tax=Mytilus coruscus TaxID=42192 RepID=A0A6J8C304_MYTCO|nr:unnamed protein product [Mytilus coruscus]